MQLVDVSAAAYFPAGQLVHPVARPSTALNLPTAHTPHDVWPVDAWAFPPGQSVQAAEPLLLVNRPDEHEEHSAALSMEYRPAAHAVQVAEPTLAE